MKSDWAIKPHWSAWTARLTGVCGFPSPITLGIRFPALRPKPWSWRLMRLASQYQAKTPQERPTSRLALARKRLQASAKRLKSRQKAWREAQRRLDKTTMRWEGQQGEMSLLTERLSRFEQDNAANPEPVEAEFRLDACFGSYENLALLIEMGYEIYTKPRTPRV